MVLLTQHHDELSNCNHKGGESQQDSEIHTRSSFRTAEFGLLGHHSQNSTYRHLSHAGRQVMTVCGMGRLTRDC